MSSLIIFFSVFEKRNIFELYRAPAVISRPLVKLSKKMHLLDKIIVEYNFLFSFY